MRPRLLRVLLAVAVATGLSTGPVAAPVLASARPAATVAALPPFKGTIEPLPRTLRRRMRGVSWRPGCPVARRGLALLRLRTVGFDGRAQRGRLVVAHGLARQVRKAFQDLYRARFPIRRMRLVEAYGGSDARSMKANNTSAFNCRRVTGGSGWSEHAYGRAIDVNPVQNPYVNGDTVAPARGRRYTDRSHRRPGMILEGGAAVKAFARIGWRWGGDWHQPVDYQHFSRTGR